MRKVGIVVLLLLGLVGTTMMGTASAGRRQEIRKNRIHSYHYKTCATCPRVKSSYMTVDRSTNTIRRSVKVVATAYNGGGTSLFSVFERATSYFHHGHFDRPVSWSANVSYNDGFWNHWDEVSGSRTFDTGGGPGPPEYRFRRVHFDLHSCWPVVGCVLNSHPYVQITARASKRDPFRTGHSHG